MEISIANVDNGIKELDKSEKYQKSSSKMQNRLLYCLSFMIILVILVLVIRITTQNK